MRALTTLTVLLQLAGCGDGGPAGHPNDGGSNDNPRNRSVGQTSFESTIGPPPQGHQPRDVDETDLHRLDGDRLYYLNPPVA